MGSSSSRGRPLPSRWPAVTGLWLLAPACLYAVLAALELRDLGYDATAPEPGYVRVGDRVPLLVDVAAVALSAVVLLGFVSLATGRLRRATDAALAAGLGLGGVLLWALDQPRPVAPALLGVGAVVLGVAAVVPQPHVAGRAGRFGARLLLATAAVLAGWVLAHELAEYSWQLRSWTVGYWAGLGVVTVMLLVALVMPWLTRPAWRWVLGVPLFLVAALALVAAVLGLMEGFLVSGYEETEDGWRLGGPPAFLATGLLAASGAVLRGRWSLAVGTAGCAVLALLALLFGIPEIRVGF